MDTVTIVFLASACVAALSFTIWWKLVCSNDPMCNCNPGETDGMDPGPKNSC